MQCKCDFSVKWHQIVQVLDSPSTS